MGYVVEAGLSSTKLVHGAPKYDTKSTPATEDLVAVRLKDVGPGTLQLGSSFAMALGDTTKKYEKAEEVLPSVTYGGKMSVMLLEVGARVWFYPRMAQVRQDVEGTARLSIPNGFLTPTLDLFPCFLEKQGLYGVVGAEHLFKLGSRFHVRPRAQVGAQGYDAKSERFHAQEVSVSSAVTALFGEGFYAAIRPSYTTLVSPSHYLADASFGGRSVAYVGFAVGAQR
ncbi:hypothetical protein AKJ09_09118 [Labilithrix luteola]|uniref:Uncharacterized protein n=1 Tax=Labilithrix luteola TaxID=1391654 RepID=A0A0K1QAK7_9BACT|nr:hypothetical protein AKJ09_09118 [Labilithrix luteola]